MKKTIHTSKTNAPSLKEISNNHNNFTRLRLSTHYHLNILEQNNKILNTIIKIIWIEFILIVISLIMLIYEKTTFTVVSCILAVLSQFTSEILFFFITLHNREKENYFNYISQSKK